MKVRLPVLFLFAISLCAAPTWAQNYNQWELFGGADYLRANACAVAVEITGIPGTCSVPVGNGTNASLRQNAYGWHGTATENKFSWLGGVMDFSGDYANRTVNFGTTSSPDNVRFNGAVYPFLFGPRFYYRKFSRLTIFGEPLLGGVHARITVASASALSIPDLPINATHWAFALGGGADYRVTDLVSIRGQGDWIRSHFPETLAQDFQNSYRLSGGIVFKF